jgi:uncharacterized protein YdaU (DUF1376 family)
VLGGGAVEKLSWFPMLTNDFLGSTKISLMTTEEIGAYALLLCHAWNDAKCTLPDDDESLRKLGRISGDLARLRACFTKKGTRLINKKLWVVWKKQQEKHRLLSESGTRGGKKRWYGQANGLATERLIAKSLQSESESESEKDLKKKREREKKPRTPEVVIPEDWGPNENHKKLATARGLDLPIEAAHFRGKAIEKAWTTINWDQKFTNWLLQEVKYRLQRRSA